MPVCKSAAWYTHLVLLLPAVEEIQTQAASRRATTRTLTETSILILIYSTWVAESAEDTRGR